MGRSSLIVLLMALLAACGAPFPTDLDVGRPPIPVPLPDVGPFPDVDSDAKGLAPSAVILSPLPDTVVAPGVILGLRGLVSDPDDALSSLEVRWQTLGAALIATSVPDANGIVEATFTLPDDGVEGVTLVVVDPSGGVGSDSSSLVANTAPGPINLIIQPPFPTAADDLMAVVDGEIEDPNRGQSEIAVIYQWYVDGELAGVEGSLISASKTLAGETWSVSARAYDGLAMGEIAEDDVLVGLTAPTVFVDAPLGADGSVLCALEDAGSLEEAETVTWYWTLPESVEIEASQSIPADSVGHCAALSCRVELRLDAQIVSSAPAGAQLAYGLDCEAATVCHEKACLPAGGCSQAPAQGPCDDGDLCTSGDACSEGACVSGESVVCPLADHGSASCVEGSCELSCDEGWADCDASPENGCEIEISEDAQCEP
jgi:hypothetical protein